MMLLLLTTAFYLGVALAKDHASYFNIVVNTMADLLSHGKTELVMLHDLSDTSIGRYVEKLAKLNALPSLTTYTFGYLEARQELRYDEQCPRYQSFGKEPGNRSSIDIPDDTVYFREPLVPFQRYAQTIVVFISAATVGQAMKILNGTVLFCNQEIFVGIFRQDNRFLFVVDPNEDSLSVAREILTGYFLTRIPNVAVIQKLSHWRDAKSMLISSKICHQTDGRLKLLKVLDENSKKSKTLEEFYHFRAKNLKGCNIKVGSLLWTHYVRMGTIIKKDNDGKMFDNYWGFEIDMLRAASIALGFDVTIIKPPDNQWGRLGLDGKWTGVRGLVQNNTYDIGLGAMGYSLGTSKINDCIMPFDEDYVTFVAPIPREVPKYMALINPLDEGVWLLILAGMLIIPCVSWKIIRYENLWLSKMEEVQGISIGDNYWYCFGILIGENLTRDKSTRYTFGFRIMMGTWMLSCLIVSHSYSGNLKSHLMTPVFTKPIATFKDVAKTKLDWEVGLFGTLGETAMRNHKDPVIKKIWNGMTPRPYSGDPDLMPVHNGKSVFIDFKSGIEPIVNVRFTTQNEKKLLQISKYDEIFNIQLTWIFHKFNLWSHQIGRVIQRYQDMGLIDTWKQKTFRRIREECESIEIIDKSPVSVVTLYDIQILFLFLCALLICSMICLPLEILVKKNYKTPSAPANKSKKVTKRRNAWTVQIVTQGHWTTTQHC